MDPVVVLVYDRRGHVRFRQRLTQLPATIGRSPRCDVILDDRQISALHARIEEDGMGQLVLRDAGSRNGLKLGRERVAEVVFPVKRAVLLGSTRIGLQKTSDDVEKTEVRRRSVLDRAWLVAPALSLVIAAEAAAGWLAADEFKVLKLVADEVMPVVLALLLWALGWAIASRIAQGAFRYLAHLTIAALAMGVVRWLNLALLPLLGFWSAISPDALRRFQEVTGVGIGGWLLAQHLFRTGPWSLKRCYAVGAIIMITIGLPYELNQLAKVDDFDTAVAIPRNALPPSLVLRTITVKDFIAETKALERKADEERRKK